MEKEEMIVNNILCYISTARNTLKNDDIIHVCLAFYKEEEIINAKDLICEIIGEKSKRRRNENRILNELKDIMEMLRTSDEKGLSLPKFVADRYDGLPPTSGFELVANAVNSLLKEIADLRNEITILKTSRNEDENMKQDHQLFKEDLLSIKGELRKLNHKLLGDEIRRSSITLGNLSHFTPIKNANHGGRSFGLHSDINGDKYSHAKTDESISLNETSYSPSAPPASQEAWGPLARAFQDEGGRPSAPPMLEIIRQEKEKQRNELVRDSNVLSVRRENEHENPLPAPLTQAQDERKGPRLDSDGFQKVEKKRKTRQNIVGSKRTDGSRGIKGASRSADIYLGNCDLAVTEDDISQYIDEEINVQILRCELLSSRNENCKSFKVTMNLNDREKLLLPEVWPEGILCRKFYSARRSS